MYLNARSVLNKLDKLEELVLTHNPDCIAIVESWTNELISNAELSLHGYDLICRKDGTDTTHGRGRGLLVYCRVGLNCYALDTITSFEQAIQFSLEGKKCVLVYRSPNIGDQDHLLKTFLSQLGPCDVIIGDFNLPGIDWKNHLASTSNEEEYIELFQDLFLQQLVDFPTHDRGNILDLILTRDESTVDCLECLKEESLSDHYPVIIRLGESKLKLKDKNQPEPSKLNFNKMDVQKLRGHLGVIDWTSELSMQPADQMWQTLKEHVLEAIKVSVPQSKAKASRQPQWMSRELLRKVRQKRRAYRMFMKERSTFKLDQYKSHVKDVKTLIRKSKKEFEYSLVNSQDKNKFYKFLSSKTKTKDGIGTLKNDEGKEVSDPKDKAELFNDFFAEVLTREDVHNIPIIQSQGEADISTVYISPEDVLKSINDCKDNLSTGNDQIPSRVYKTAADILAYPLSMVYNMSMCTSTIPQDWKEANIVPIFKKGSRTKVCNYRPISLTSLGSRIMERCIKRKLMDFLENNQILNNAQHGFRKERSTLSNLLQYMDMVSEAVDQGNQVDAIYLDFSKAFDKVPHLRLLKKLEAIGVKGYLLNWIRNWLTGRRQRVTLHDQVSDWTETMSSVPQGSVLGPILFLIYINDLCDVIKDCNLSMFADDTKIFKVVKNEQDKETLQDNINAMSKWCQDWQMSLNLTKCHSLSFGNKRQYTYELNGQQLTEVNCERDVGVLVPSNLKYTEHCGMVVSKANSVLGLIKRSFHTRDTNIILNAYKTYVLPHLEYCSQIWSPNTKKWKDKIERVQKRAMKLIPSLRGLSYKEKLNKVGLLTLENRRIMMDLISAYKNKSTPNTCPVQGPNTRITRSHLNKEVEKPRFRLDLRKNFHSIRVVSHWNSLPLHVRESKSISTFKANVKSILMTNQNKNL